MIISLLGDDLLYCWLDFHVCWEEAFCFDLTEFSFGGTMISVTIAF